MNRSFTTAALLLGFTRLAAAQAADPSAPPAPPAPPAADQPPAPPQPETPPTPPTTAPVAVDVLPTVPEKPTEPAKKDEKPSVTAKYDGGLKFESSDEKYELKLSFRNQFRFESTRPLEEGSQYLDHFYIPRSRLQAEGFVFGKDNRYKVEFGFGDGGTFAFLKDMYMERKVADKVYLRAGQWKRPFNRQELVSDFASTFNERSIQNELAGGGRSAGIALHNDYEKSPEGVEWVAGVFNTFSGGSDRPTQSTTCTQDAAGKITCAVGRPTNDRPDFSPALVVRVGYNSPKIKGYSESDLEGGPLRYAVGLAYKVDLANFDQGRKAGYGDNISHGVEADAMIKAEGFSAHLGVVAMKIKDADANLGIHIQPGYMLTPKTLEVAGRFAMTTEKEKDRNQIEVRGALNYYMHGHSWKLATDAGFLKYTGDGAMGDKPDLQLRIMGQMQI